MLRRIHVPRVVAGEIELDSAGAHHARNVLRLDEGTPVEVFDDAGAVAAATLIHRGQAGAAVRIEAIAQQTISMPRLVIASAVPKGDRADWMVEKLSEIGVAEFIPLAAARSVVLPEGKGKRDRWMRLATEAAKQSRRRGVMSIAPLTQVADAISQAKGRGAYLSTEPQALSVHGSIADFAVDLPATLFIGPEGGWTDEEVQMFTAADFRALRLTNTVLRVETAAILGAGIFLSRESEV